MATIAENLQRLIDAKNEIIIALSAKGIAISDKSGFEDFADAIQRIISGNPKLYAIEATDGESFEHIDEFGVTLPIILKTENINKYLDEHPEQPCGLVLRGVSYRIGASSFKGRENIIDVVFPEELTSIGDSAFYGCKNIGFIRIPDRVTELEPWVFRECPNLVITKLPEKLVTIARSAFQDSPNIAVTEIPASVDTIDTYAFSGCNGLTKITFKGTPTLIKGTAFSNCPNLTEINVPWSIGEVDNAPWGAKEADIHYDYVEEIV